MGKKKYVWVFYRNDFIQRITRKKNRFKKYVSNVSLKPGKGFGNKFKKCNKNLTVTKTQMTTTRSKKKHVPAKSQKKTRGEKLLSSPIISMNNETQYFCIAAHQRASMEVNEKVGKPYFRWAKVQKENFCEKPGKTRNNFGNKS